jgi:hypothetical protein
MRARTSVSILAAIAVGAACGSSNGGGGGGGDGGSGGGSSSGGSSGGGDGSVLADGSVTPTAACKSEGGSAPVQTPKFVRNIAAGETGWFSSPAVVDLDGNGKKEIVAPLYSTFVFDASGNQLAKGTATMDRVYAPGVVADLDHDGVTGEHLQRRRLP